MEGVSNQYMGCGRKHLSLYMTAIKEGDNLIPLPVETLREEKFGS